MNITFTTALQIQTPAEIKGRVFGVMGTIISGLMPLGMGISAIVADLLNRQVSFIFLFCCIVILLFSIFIFRNREMRQYIACSEAPEEASVKVKGEAPKSVSASAE
ncbi:MAG: hypothetical protein JW969_13320 [Spirochaetales bacterium]|nr:hypothetical protein [Spirochaetales bacterium]